MDKKALGIIGGLILMLAGGILFWFKSQPSLKFSTIKVLDKKSFIRIITEIRQEFSKNFSTILKLNRKKRRNLHRGGREYRICVRDLKEHVRRCLDRATEDVLERNRLNEEILTETYNYMETDPEVALAANRLCAVQATSVSPLLDQTRINEILEFFSARAREISEEDPNELNIKLKIVEDEVFEEFGFEPEEIEAAISKYEGEMGDWIQKSRDIHNTLFDNANEDYF